MKLNQFGRSMVEMLGVLAIIGVLSIGGIAGYSKAMEKHKINKTIDEINTILGNALVLVQSSNFKDSEILCGSDFGIDNRNCDTIKKLNIVPEHMWKTPTKIVTSTGHPAGILLLGTNSMLRIGFHFSDQEPVNAISNNKNLCISLLTTDWSYFGEVLIDADPYIFTTPGLPLYNYHIPLSIADAEKICSNKKEPLRFMLFQIDLHTKIW